MNGGVVKVKIPKTINTGIEQNEELKKQGMVTAQQKAINYALINVGKQLMQNSVEMITKFNSNTYAVKKANEVLSLGAELGSFASLGFVGVFAAIAKYSADIFSSMQEQKLNNMEYELAFKRSGNAALSNSRGY